MLPPEIRIVGIAGLPEVVPGDDVGELIARALRNAGIHLEHKDVLVVAQKIISKAEGRLVRLDGVRPSPLAQYWADAHGKDAQQVEVIMHQARRMVRMEKGVLIAETRQGFVCANAGVDASNVPPGTVSLLPLDPDVSAGRLRETLQQTFGVSIGVIVADTFGRPWREGIVNVALGVAGLNPFMDYRGELDRSRRRLDATVVTVADELASAAELVMGKSRHLPVALIRGFDYREGEGAAKQIIRPADRDLFR